MRPPIKAQSAHSEHVPVLMAEVLDALAPAPGRTFIDGTFGAGGYSKAMLATGASVIGIDRDPDAFANAKALEQQYGTQFTAFHGRFSEMEGAVKHAGLTDIDGVTLDIGVSSMQLDQAMRGFSFLRDGPLDMRMAQTGVSAADLVNRASEKALAHIIFVYGEEKRARAAAKAICAARQTQPIETTKQLADLLADILGKGPKGHHPATRVFQALRIAVNGELEELAHALFAAERLLVPGGVLAIVSFHSLEDRIVKKFMALGHAPKATSRYAPMQDGQRLTFERLVKPVKPSEQELADNPRARSAILRCAIRSDAPARDVSFEGLGLPGRFDKSLAADAPVWGELS